MKGPYDGLIVVEMTADIAGSHLGQICADRGATVIKVEPPSGDPLRHHQSHQPGESKLFQALNRGKDSVMLSIDSADGEAILNSLLASADALLLSLPLKERPDCLLWEKLNLRFKQLVVVDITPFGEKGPWARRRGNDLVMQAYAGTLLSEGKTADDGRTPMPLTSTQVSEHGTALTAAVGLSSALLHRQQTGRGQKVSVAKLLTVLAIQSARVVLNPAADKQTEPARQAILKARRDHLPVPEVRAARRSNTARVVNPFYRPYQTRDGAVFLGALTRGLRDKAREAIGTGFMGRDDPNFDPQNAEHIEDAFEQQAAIEERIKSESTEAWIKRLEKAGVPTGEVLFPEDLTSEPQLRENYYVSTVNHETDGDQVQVMPHAQSHRFPDPALTGAPGLGRDNDKWKTTRNSG